ncbi:4Fe-4S binding protein [Chrysiogenes arsenatis]|uniref:4Fe-4S binding protein n=1 Tax=Chrysiogenes arsenatis TaxID=309797 RepID=UPI00042156E1|nr:4Fe-4S binding protein [Chrysiogenes arsenatis]
MFNPKEMVIVQTVARISETLRCHTSRCLRSRFFKNNCQLCKDVCPVDAVTLQSSVSIDYDRCTQCMLCVGACPNGAIESKFAPFHLLVKKLNDVPTPVLGCSAIADEKRWHADVPCLGIFSAEHFIAFSVLVRGVIQINLTRCHNCRNGSMVSALQQRFAEAIHIYPPVAKKVVLVTETHALQFAPKMMGRRAMFGFLREKATEEAARVFHLVSAEESKSTSYGVKALPSRRQLLNHVTRDFPVPELTRFGYPFVAVSNTCVLCPACSAICPTGALVLHDTQEEGKVLKFDRSLCTGCGLCAEFCPKKAIGVCSHLAGDAPATVFEISILKREEE